MKPRLVYLDALRILAIIAVVLLHVVITPPNSLTQDPQEWWLTIVYKSLFIWAAPIFFMISGALLLKKDESIRTVYVKRIPRILLPFLVWNCIYIYFDVAHSKGHTYIGEFVKSLSQPIIYHFWFIYVLIGLYIITPFLRMIVKVATKKQLELFIFLCFLVSSILPFISKLTGVFVDLSLPYFQGYIGFYILGYYLSTFMIQTTLKRVIYGAALASVPLSILLTYAYTKRIGYYDDSFMKSLSFPLIFTAPAIYLFIKSCKLPPLPQYISIPRVCFGIFFSHVLILGILEGGKLGFSLTEKVIYPPLGVLLNTFVVLALCGGFFLVLELLQKYRVVRFLSQFLY